MIKLIVKARISVLAIMTLISGCALVGEVARVSVDGRFYKLKSDSLPPKESQHVLEVYIRQFGGAKSILYYEISKIDSVWRNNCAVHSAAIYGDFCGATYMMSEYFSDGVRFRPMILDCTHAKDVPHCNVLVTEKAAYLED